MEAATALRPTTDSAIPDLDPSAVSSTAYARQLLADNLDQGVANPHDAVNGILDELTEGQIREITYAWLHDAAVDIVAGRRRRAFAGTPQVPSARWDVVAESSRRRLLEDWIYTGTEHKRLGDCTRSDLEGAAERDRTQGESMIRRADQYVALAKKLSRGKVVRDLSERVVEGVFNA